MLFANLDVTTHVLTWIITLLADNAAVQSKLRNEIQANISNIDGYINKKDSYLHNCFFESLRVRPVSGMLDLEFVLKSNPNDHERSAFTIPESSPSVKKFKGFIIPKNVSSARRYFPVQLLITDGPRRMSLSTPSLSTCATPSGEKTALLSALSGLRTSSQPMYVPTGRALLPLLFPQHPKFL